MANKRILVTQQELNKLTKILNSMKDNHRMDQEHLKQLYTEMGDALVVTEEDLPTGFVTMYSRITYTNLQTQEQESVRLVFPAETSKSEENRSIFSPVGAALIGEIAGSICVCYAPGDRQIPLRVDAIEGKERHCV